jgi:hypothetical protein
MPCSMTSGRRYNVSIGKAASAARAGYNPD